MTDKLITQQPEQGSQPLSKLWDNPELAMAELVRLSGLSNTDQRIEIAVASAGNKDYKGKTVVVQHDGQLAVVTELDWLTTEITQETLGDFINRYSETLAAANSNGIFPLGVQCKLIFVATQNVGPLEGLNVLIQAKAAGAGQLVDLLRDNRIIVHLNKTDKAVASAVTLLTTLIGKRIQVQELGDARLEDVLWKSVQAIGEV